MDIAASAQANFNNTAATTNLDTWQNAAGNDLKLMRTTRSRAMRQAHRTAAAVVVAAVVVTPLTPQIKQQRCQVKT
jgi:uncharacterized membrane protein YccC